jgi:ferrous iron transport protein B
MKEDTGASKKRLILVGNPNVGKSVIFGYLTGRYTIVSNYPGTTVEVSRGEMRYGGVDYEVVDTPGTNSLVPQSEDERVTRNILEREPADLLVQVADVKNLRRTLLLTSQLAELGRPMILVLNLMDEARQRGIKVDSEAISRLFGIPVVETVAPYGEGLSDLSRALGRAAVPVDPLAVAVGEAHAAVPALAVAGASLPVATRPRSLGTRGPVDLERRRAAFVDDLVADLKTVEKRTAHDAADTPATKLALGLLVVGLLLLLHTEIGAQFGWTTLYDLGQRAVQAIAPPLADALANGLGLLSTLLVGVRNDEGTFEFGLLQAAMHFLTVIAPVAVPFLYLIRQSRSFAERFGVWSRSPVYGAPILVTVLVLVYEFVGYIGAQTLVGTLEEGIFNGYLNPLLRATIPLGFFHDLLVGNPANNYHDDYGLISVGLTYSVAIVLPVVGTFFIAFSLLEDSGYLPRLAILGDRLFRLMGLNGKAILPMVLGLGCDTMATMTTRILATPKERLIATLLLALGVPCSAQLGVILGISAGISPVATLVVLGVVASQMLLVGYLSSKLIKGAPSPFLFEIPPIRVPVVKNVAVKTWYRIKWFLREAVPLFILGTLILFLLDRLRVPFTNGAISGIDAIESIFRPVVVGVLQMPAETAKVFILGFLRRDYGAAGLFDMAKDGALSVQQLVVAMIVMTLFVPCIANFFVMIKEQGAKKAFAILAFITPFAIAVGGIVGVALRALHLFE